MHNHPSGRSVGNHGARIETKSFPVAALILSSRSVGNHGARIGTKKGLPWVMWLTGRSVGNHGARIETHHPDKFHNVTQVAPWETTERGLKPVRSRGNGTGRWSLRGKPRSAD